MKLYHGRMLKSANRKYYKATADKVLELRDPLHLTDLIYNMYERYHCESLDNAFDDIDSLVEEKKNVL